MSADLIFLRELEGYLSRHALTYGYGVPELAHSLGVSVATLKRKLSAMGQPSPGILIRNYRINRVKIHLQTTRWSVKQIAAATGFNDASACSRAFKAIVGDSPEAYRNRFQQVAQVRYSGTLPLGQSDAEEWTLLMKEHPWLKRFFQTLAERFHQGNFRLQGLERELGLSAAQLHRNSHQVLGMPTARFMLYLRLAYAVHLLVRGKRSVTEVAHEVGFADTSHFCRVFRANYGSTPHRFRQQASHTSINAFFQELFDELF